MVEFVNKLYDGGHIINIYTARGMNQFNGDVEKIYALIFEITETQLHLWGVKYHKLIMGKLHYDVLIDDKCCRPNEIDTTTTLETLHEKIGYSRIQ
jgi:hypothetical protein